MATNKNQHFVPRCYLRPFTLNSANRAINLFNIDRRVFVERAPARHQCSGDYFYGENPDLERALQSTEGAYARVLQDVLTPGVVLTDDQRRVLQHFWLLQHLRTEAASRRSVEMTDATRSVIGVDGPEFNLSIREAVLLAMGTFVQVMDGVSDLRVCLLRNLTSVPFVTSDNPVCVGYDGDVYRVRDEDGWDEVRKPADVDALNQHQFLNCHANIFVGDAAHSGIVRESYERVAHLRPSTRHRIHYAVRDGEEGGTVRYRVVDPSLEDGRHQEAIIHTETVHARPSAWPWQVRSGRNGVVFSNGSAVGYVRRAWVRPDAGRRFRREAAWPW